MDRARTAPEAGGKRDMPHVSLAIKEPKPVAIFVANIQTTLLGRSDLP